MSYHNPHVSVARLQEIQDNAKAAARKAMATGKTDELTALGRAYYEKYSGVKADAA